MSRIEFAATPPRITYWRPNVGDEILGTIRGFYEWDNGRAVLLEHQFGRIVVRPTAVIENSLVTAEADVGDSLWLKFIGIMERRGDWPYKLFTVQIKKPDGAMWRNGVDDTIPEHWF